MVLPGCMVFSFPRNESYSREFSDRYFPHMLVLLLRTRMNEIKRCTHYGGPLIRVGVASASTRCQSGVSGESQWRSVWHVACHRDEMCSKKGGASSAF